MENITISEHLVLTRLKANCSSKKIDASQQYDQYFRKVVDNKPARILFCYTSSMRMMEVFIDWHYE